ncbi:hypothetical protein KPH14_002459 [Odynerus spinipes]|uniref:Uncharacterized protein n=1 Tax=Odynerus spinipes TaxID=1348599 RepID=A0AAD9RG02_9HYME|nr:hypothetical protein KPH14_002459 [Odynerus spinipes]
MMAGTGVSVGGAGMLRTRRRDVSVKPNRKLDRKSSRGMIYENEELRLRTIHINAEVEQGQNDIKKLRRENEQLRREIWSLRDEYDKLEEILKRQKSRGESDESEDRSEEDDELHSDYSYEDEQEEAEKVQNENESTTEEYDQEEQLENAENQKISTEKMNSNSLHRLHVDFDDLSVVDEEEELKKDKEKKEAISTEDNSKKPTVRVLESRQQLHDNVPFYPASYDSANSYTDSNYFSECPFEFPNTLDSVIQASNVPATVLPSPCLGLYPDPLMPLATLDSPILNPVSEPIIPEIHVPPVGWQNNLILPEATPLSTYPGVLTSTVTTTPVITARMPVVENSLLDGRAEYRPFTSAVGLRQRRNLDSRQPGKQLDLRILENPSGYIPRQQHGASQDGWGVDASGEKNFNRERMLADRNIENEDKESDETYALNGAEKPKHFFAPLPTKTKKFLGEDSPTTGGTNYFGTGNSSSSGKTGSTVICGNNKGSVDVCVNGAVSYGNNFMRDKEDTQRTFLSTDNLPIESIKPTLSNQLIKSMSCQDLTSECQSLAKMKSTGERAHIMTKSDNTLDSISSGTSTKAYKSHLNVTLKIPRVDRETSADTPEIPQLPSTDYRFLTNPFLRNIERTGLERADANSPATKPLSVQVSENNINYNYPSSPTPLTSFARSLRPSERYLRRQGNLASDQNRLLIPTDRLMAAKNLSPTQDFQVTSFERPSPHTILPSAMPYDLGTLRRINATRYLQSQNLYQNVPFVPAGPTGHVCPSLRMYYEQGAMKVPAQTQTSIDGDSHVEDDQLCQPEEDDNNLTASAANSPSGQRRKRTIKKDKIASKDHKSLVSSPHAQRKLRKQSSVTSTETQDSPGKSARQRARKLSVTTTTTSEALEDKNESRSSSSGQDSPRKDQARRVVSTYFNPKKRPSVTSIKTTRSGSLDTSKEKYSDVVTSNSEKEAINFTHVRDGLNAKSRKGSTSSGNVPWCACWGNGCI